MTITVNKNEVLAVLDERGWEKNGDGHKFPGEPISLYGALYLCAFATPGDAAIIETCLIEQEWQSIPFGYTETELRERIARGIEISNSDLAEVFGPQWRAVVNFLRQLAVLTPTQRYDFEYAAKKTNLTFYYNADVDDDRKTACKNARFTATRICDGRFGDALVYVHTAATLFSTWELVGHENPYVSGRFTPKQRNEMIAPWAETIGLPACLLGEWSE